MITTGNIAENARILLEIGSWICNNNISAFLRVVIKTCPSEVRQHRLYDWIGLFIYFLFP